MRGTGGFRVRGLVGCAGRSATGTVHRAARGGRREPGCPHVLSRLARAQLRGYAGPAGVLVVLQTVQIAGTLLLPTLGAALIDEGVVRADPGRIAELGTIMAGVAVAQIVAALAATALGARTSTAMGRDLRSAVFGRILDFSAREVGRFGTASLLTRTVNDVQQVQNLARSGFGVVVSAPLMCVGSVVLALQQDVPLALLLVVLVLVVGVCFGLLMARMGTLYDRMQVTLDGLGRLLRESITGVRVVRSFVRDDHEQQRFTRTNDAFLDLSQRVGRLIATMLPLVLLLMNLFTVVLMWVGARRIDAGVMQLGALSAFLFYLSLILMSVVMVAFVFLQVPRARVCAGRIMEVLDTEPGVPAPADPVPMRGPTGRVELDDVEFRYPGAERAVLHGIGLTVEPGERVAVLGSTGSGKTTLLNLVLRLVDPTAGTVRVGGTDVRELDPAVLTDAVGFVPQRPYLFAGTVASNLRFGRPDATDDELWEALRVAQADGFVARMPGGLDAEVAQGGTTVSGGQRQRLCIARTLLRRPGVYLFDDCFSALDQATDAALRAALVPWTAGATVITVTQRVSTARDAGRVVVLDAGRLVADGTHDDVLRDSPTYREIAHSQLTEEDAAHGLAGRH
ncbi:Lipid A export ATP-binding/permease protein MsbA [Pseudonocardia sp. Ae168_Ps1]|nr:Lipid A export ATP-binding/permease protein MsbA [Pseudonocardia sp. Ae168_Ps1]OLL87613.1 Lipid A export ATP-binding/permease protein MsbA [Pseudonocardia sp. Ae263_Ps1]OLL92358.1 Lipid A export ATP-binding/permease protein MsbA [Pseudonocardia sp. Ae356_Ps1]